jgi:hypothetical protein
LPLAPGAHAHETRNARRRRSSARLGAASSFVRFSLRSRRHSCIVGHPRASDRSTSAASQRHRDAPEPVRPDRCKVIKYLAGPGVFFPDVTPCLVSVTVEITFNWQDEPRRRVRYDSRGSSGSSAQPGSARGRDEPGFRTLSLRTNSRPGRGGAFNTHMSTELHLPVSPSRRICGP